MTYVASQLRDQLEYDPMLFVTGLPASPAVDYMMSLPCDLPASNPAVIHEASFEGLQDLPSRVASCMNPDTLLQVVERTEASGSRSSHALQVEALTNPCTPRTDLVQRRTLEFLTNRPERLAAPFARYYATARSTQYDRDTHADLLYAISHVTANSLTTALLGAAWNVGSAAVNDPRFERPRLFDDLLQSVFDSHLQREHASRKNEDTDLPVEIPGFPVLSELLNRRPDSLTADEQATAVQLLHEYRSQGTSAALPGLAVWLLDHHELSHPGAQPPHHPPVAPYPGPMVVERWARSLVEDPEGGELSLRTSPSRPEPDPGPIAKAAGHMAAERFGMEDTALWATMVNLLEEGWEGSIVELLDTVAATAG